MGSTSKVYVLAFVSYSKRAPVKNHRIETPFYSRKEVMLASGSDLGDLETGGK